MNLPLPLRSVRPLWAFVLLVASACTQSDVIVVDASRVEVTPSEAGVIVGQQTQLTASVLASGGQPLSGRTVTWASDDPAVATADDHGRVVGVSIGTTTIRATSEGATGTARVTVTAGPVPLLSVNPESVSFAAVQNGASPGERTVTVTNSGTGQLGALAVAVRYPAGGASGWLNAVLGGTTAPATITLSASQAGLAAGTYTAFVDVSADGAPNSPVVVAVQLTVAGPQPAIGLGATGVTFAAPAGGANPTPQSVAVTNAGGGTLSGLASAVTYAAGQPTGWLSAALGSSTAPTTLQLMPITGALPVGVYTATVRVSSATAQNSPQDVQVTFTVGSPPPAIGVNPTSLAFTAVTGAAAPTQTVAITNPGSGSLTGLAVAVTYPGGQPQGWVTTSLSGTTAPATLTVGANAASLPAGTYTASISVTSPVASNSPQTVQVTFTVSALPNAPSGLVATAVNATRVDLTWSDNSADETGFQLERSVSGGAWTPLASLGPNATSYSDLTAAPGTTYGYRVRACREAACSAFSAAATATTPVLQPGVPANLTATTVSPTRIDIAWGAPASGGPVVGYRIDRRVGTGAFALLDSVGAATLSRQDTGLNPGTTYGYRVQACNAAGCSAYSPVASATTGSQPSIALNPTTVSFAAQAGGADPAKQTVAVTNASGGTLSGLAATVSYAAGQPNGWLTATLAGTTAPTTLELSATTGALAAGVYTATVSVSSGTAQNSPQTVQVTFTVGSPPPSIGVSPSTLGFAAVAGATAPAQQVSITNTGGGSLTGLGVAVTYPEGQPTGWLTTSLADSTAPTTLTVGANATSLAAGTYTATIRITSPVATNSPQTVAVTFQVGAVPNPPAGLTATAVSGTRVDLAWTDNSSDETGFRIERSVGTGGWTLLASPTANTTSFSDTTVSAGVTYNYRVQACSAAGCSAFSGVATATTPSTGGVPGAPTGITFTDVTASSLTVNWTAPTTGGTVAWYYVERRITGARDKVSGDLLPGTTSFADSGLQSSTPYRYRVLACNAAGCTASAELTVTTAAGG